MESRWGADLEVVRTIPPSEGSNIQVVRGALEPGITVVGVGGDGLQHDVFNGIQEAIEAGEIGPDEVSMVPAPSGGGNDMSRSLYGGDILRSGGAKLWDILDRGAPSWLDGIKFDDGDRFDRFAHSYLGFGFTAQVAEAINRPDFRERRAGFHPLSARALDGIEVLKALLEREPFQYENGRGSREVQEVIYSLAPRIGAGVIRLDTHMLDGEMVHLEVGSKAFLPNAVAKLTSGLLGGTRAEYIDGPQQLVFHTPTSFHYDGEPAVLPAGATVSISHQRDVVQALV
jgi:hypothetical protein